MVDSAFNYTATVNSIRIASRQLNVTYAVTPEDSARPPVYRLLPLPSGSITDSMVEDTIKNSAYLINAQYKAKASADSDNPTFDDSDFVGDTYNLRFKPRTADSYPAFDAATQRIDVYDSEGPDEIRQKYTLVTLSDSARATQQSIFAFTRVDLMKALRDNGLDSQAISAIDPAHPKFAAWDASAAGSYDWSTDKIASFGVDSVSRVQEGSYRIHFRDDFADSNYAVSTAIGAERYGGAGGSPRQLSIIKSETNANYVTVHCERTDDAVDEDNSYFSVIVSPADNYEYTDAQLNWKFGVGSLTVSDSTSQVIQTAIGLNDSDYVTMIAAVQQS